MINEVTYTIKTHAGPRHILIVPLHEKVPGCGYCPTGEFKLSCSGDHMGVITFDEEMSNWEYDAFDELNLKEATEIADFIKNYKDPESADADLIE